MAAQGQTSLHDFFPTVRREPAFPVKRQLGSSALPSQLPSKKRKTLEQAQNSPFKSQTDLPKTVPVIQNVTPPSSPRKLKTPATPEPLTRGRMMVALARQKAGSSTPLGRQPGQSMRVRFSDKKMTARRRLLDDIHDHHDHTADPLLPAEKSVVRLVILINAQCYLTIASRKQIDLSSRSLDIWNSPVPQRSPS